MADLMETCFGPLQTFSLVVAYWHALENACLKQVHGNFP
jgi:hypothetical protein